MERTPLPTSRSIISAGWEDGTLEIEFNNGKVYQAFDVPQEVYTALIYSPSPGRYFNAMIEPNYTFTME